MIDHKDINLKSLLSPYQGAPHKVLVMAPVLLHLPKQVTK